MSDLPAISDETLEILKKIPTQTLIDGLWVKNWPMLILKQENSVCLKMFIPKL